MKHEFSTTFEIQPKQMYYEMVYSRPNTMIGIMWTTIAEEALCSFLRHHSPADKPRKLCIC